MTTKIEKYELARSMSDEQFDMLSKIMKGGKHGLFEYIGHYGKYAIAGLLAYVSYDYFNNYDALLGWLTAISAGMLFLYDSISAFISSAIYSIHIMRNKDYDEAMKLTDMANDLRKQRIQNTIDNLEKLEKQADEDND